ncbi:hypothetical protein G3N57_38230, partial [Paraburkholderia sp. Se-20369]|nr:hypothetical protein [Paraburkholderia sp. Se-20369]
IGTIVRVVGLEATLGELCELRSASGVLIQHAEVVGFTRNVALPRRWPRGWRWSRPSA